MANKLTFAGLSATLASYTNPQEEDDSKAKNQNGAPGKGLLDVAAAPAPVAAAPASPFDFDVDFAQVQKRRERVRAQKEAAKAAEQQAILRKMDEVEETPIVVPTVITRENNILSNSISINEPIKMDESKVPLASASLQQHTAPAPVGGGQRRPKIVTKAKAAETSNQDKGLLSFMGFSGNDKGYEEDLDAPRDTMVKVGNRKIAIWPYDDYHLTQQAYYQRLDSGTLGTDAEDHGRGEEVVDSGIPIFQRPADPPDIPSAVLNLPLTEFEAKAEERSIAIVSTWLFDAGLIDELLVNGGMSGTLLAHGDEKTDEGVEIGSHGFPLEGSTKMDKEIAKLRNSTNRQLALINARLNDGVAATGSEVQELVNLVIATKDDIGRLRELSTYMSNPESMQQSSEFMLTKYPKLRTAVNARRNVARCFRELDFFSQIPSTCDRLREELESAEWTAHEWSTLRSVCREHVELEIFLVEAEAGMKKRLVEEEEEQEAQRQAAAGKKGGRFNAAALSNVGLQNNRVDLIDRFLSDHVDNVWELGDEIRMRILSGIASAFELAINNPGAMVALVEAVEVYETAHVEYKTVHGVEAGEDSASLRFTDMRAAALGELYKDFERRGLDIFNDLVTQAADVAEEEEASNQQFSAVLRAANELTSEIGVVKEQMAPCFPPTWSIETVWTTGVAHVCSNNILQQIGGPEGNKLPDLTVTQLLDLVAWVETFREIIHETFPNIASIASKRTYFEKPPQLLLSDGKSVDLDAAQDSLAWVNNILWDVHDLSKDEFLYRTKEQTEEWLDNVYEADTTKTQTAEGRLVTSLCEDVWSLAGVQLRTIRERLTRRSEALVQAVGVIFKNLYEKQIETRDRYCRDFEECCAASNDFVRMSEKCEEIVGEIQDECNLSPESTETLEEQAAALLGLYSNDAVYAAQKTHLYIFEPIEEAIIADLFGEEWQDSMTHNELALTLVRTLDDFMEDLETFLDGVMVQKCVEAQISASVNFYIKALVKKSAEHNTRESYFTDNGRAIARMRGDIQTIQEYFEGLSESMPTLARMIEREFRFLDAVIEILSIAAGTSSSDVHDFILVLQKHIKNFAITKFVVGDLYHLVNPQEEHPLYELVDSMEQEMSALCPNDETAASVSRNRLTVPGLRIDHLLARLIESNERNRPLQPGALDRAADALRGWNIFGRGESKNDDDSGED